MANTKLNGQIWISRTEPYNLKYRYNDKNYIVSVVENFDYNSSSGITTGSVIAIDSTNGIRKAVFPDDLDKVVGLAYVKENQIFLVNKGEITVDTSAFQEYEILGENIILTKGDPVFWYIGKTGSSYGISDYGKLTVYQPNGQKPTDPIIDNALNIGYDNLPQIGTVKSVVDSNNIVITIIPPVFDSSLEWHWPKERFSEISNNTVEMKHGLLIDSSKCFSTCEILSKPSNSDTEYRSFADITQNYDNTQNSHSKSTTIKVHSLTNHSYKVSGTVYYNK